MSDTTRRGFLVIAGAGAAAAGASAIGVAAAASSRTGEQLAPQDLASAESFVVHVKDVRKGQLAILVGDREVLIEDRELATRLAGAAQA